jgi:hypothetical protein
MPAPLPVSKIGVSALGGILVYQVIHFNLKHPRMPLFTKISDAVNLADNFFSILVTQIKGIRKSTSTNLLGYDIKNVKIPNALNRLYPMMRLSRLKINYRRWLRCVCYHLRLRSLSQRFY